MVDLAYLSFDELHKLVSEVLHHGGLNKRHAAAIARVIVKAERDQCRSHGLYRIAGVLKTLRGGIAVPNAEPKIDNPTDKAIVKIHAGGSFSPLAFESGAPILAEKAKKFGIAAMAINDCVHFSALWPEVEQLAEMGVAALAMCPSNAYVAPAGGIRKLLGTNPLAFAWPEAGANPYVFDFATSVVARGEVELHKLDNKKLPNGWAIDKNGQATNDAAAALEGALLTFGGYKGSAISTMIELLAAILIGDLLSFESSELDNGRLLAPRHGELLIAINLTAFGALDTKTHTQKLLNEFSLQGARLPSQRRYSARLKSEEKGIAVSLENLNKLKQLCNVNSGYNTIELH